jgi:phosphatidylglycerol:prolipoprotein diacylglycerol transferase
VIPFIHLGPLPIPTFGLMVACAMLGAYFVLRGDLARRGLSVARLGASAGKSASGGKSAKTAAKVAARSGAAAKAATKSAASTVRATTGHIEAETLIAIPCLAGIIGAKLYHVLETPADLLASPLQELFSPYGFAWFGGFLAGLAAFIWIGRSKGVPLLELFDAGSPAAALGYGIGRIGCLLSGDGDYGIPTSLPWGMSFPNGLVPTTERVHPTPIYEFIAACAIAWILWRLGARQVASWRVTRVTNATRPLDAARADVSVGARHAVPGDTAKLDATASSADALPAGTVFAAYLVLTGVARFLVEFIRINPRSFLGMSNAQAAGLASAIAGAALWWWLARKHTDTRASAA